MERTFGWKRQSFDSRDLKYSVSKPVTGLPSSVDLRLGMPAIYDQGNIGSCTAHGIARALQYAEKKAGLPEIMPSRLFLYFNERKFEGTITEDAGAIIRDGFKACNIYGVADETLWPYQTDKFTETPPDIAYQNAAKEKIRYYASIDNTNLDSIKLCHAHGYPIVFGMDVYANFQNYKRGEILSSPKPGTRYMGGHCMCTGGYDDSKEAVLVANSWGEDWGEDGWLWISYEYFTSRHVSDNWMVRLK